MNKKMRGMTLLELTVVLAILAVVTSIAVASFTVVEDQSRFDSTVRQLEEIENAVLGDKNLRAPDNQPLVTGFVADIGRLPVASATLELTELWSNPNNLSIYAMRPATYNATPALSNIASVFEWNGTAFTSITVTANHADAGIMLGTGWRGDYVRLGAGMTTLSDGWSNQLRYFKADGTTVVSAGDEIEIVRSLGSNGVVGGATIPESDRDLAFRTTLINRAVGSVSLAVDPAISSATEVRLYSADPTTGKLRVYVHPFNSATASYAFPSIPIGPKIARAYNGATAVSRPLSVMLTGVVPLQTLRP